MATGPITSPYRVEIPDNYGKVIWIEFPFDSVTRALSGATVHRDSGCQWNIIYVGVGGDGTVETSPRLFNLRGIVGERSFTAGQLSAQGLSTIEHVLVQQITAGS